MYLVITLKDITHVRHDFGSDLLLQLESFQVHTLEHMRKMFAFNSELIERENIRSLIRRELIIDYEHLFVFAGCANSTVIKTIQFNKFST